MNLPSEIYLYISSFLENRDLLESCLINKGLYFDLKELLKKKEMIHLFLHECSYSDNLFTLSKPKKHPVYQQKIYYFKTKEKNEIISFFDNLQLIFRLISEKSITKLELCPRTTYGELPIYHIYSDTKERYKIYENVINAIIASKTLKKVNISIFAEYLGGDKENIKENIQRRLDLQTRLYGHPSLEKISISHPTATTFYSQLPVNLICQNGVWFWTFD